MRDLQNFITISKYAGERFDLVQAGGGNSSVKLNDGTMLIKSSGVMLNEITTNYGYSKVLTSMVFDIVKDDNIIKQTDKKQRLELSSSIMQRATLDLENRPSIETLLHSMLYKYTLHTHPIVVNMVVNKNNWKEILTTIFDEDIIMVEYRTPGIELALELYSEIQKYREIPKIIFLQNHGLIVTSTESGDIKYLNEYVISKIEQYLNVDMTKYKLTNLISNLNNQSNNQLTISYLSNDLELNLVIAQNKSLFFKTPFCPDSLVYCGVSAVELNKIDDINVINDYKNKYHEIPKVIIFENKIFISAPNIKKAKEIEEVLKFHIIVLAHNMKDINFLPFEELMLLSNWDAEKYRREL